MYEIAIVDGAGRCRLRKLIPMIRFPHLGVNGPASSNLPTYTSKVDIFEGSADECRAMSTALRQASNSVLDGQPAAYPGKDKP